MTGLGLLVTLGLWTLAPAVSAQTITYTYDSCANGVGRLCTVSDPSGPQTSETFVYDQRGNLKTNTKLIAGTSYRTDWSYDSLNRVVDLTYPSAATRETIRHFYNAQGLLNQIQAVTYGGNYVTNLDYNANSQVIKRVLGNGLTTNYTYADATHACPRNNNFRLCTVITSTLQNLTYAYDPVGNVTDITDGISPNYLASQHFTYDALNRLTDANTTNASTPAASRYTHTTATNTGYVYNTIGNLTSAAGTSYSYPAAGQLRPHAPLTAGAYSYQYDANGNLQTRTNGSTTRTVTWDAENRLTEIKDNGVSKARFRYDHAGQRVQKIAAATTTYAGALQQHVINGARTNFIFANGQRVAARDATGVTYYLTDHLGSTSTVTGSTSQTLAYFPYGAERYNSLGSAAGVAHQFTGQERDEETGLYDYGARFYDPDLRRFISADPIGVNSANPQTLNRYAYALNNPLRYVDPSGNQACENNSLCLRTGPSFEERLAASFFGPPVLSFDVTADIQAAWEGASLYERYVPPFLDILPTRDELISAWNDLRSGQAILRGLEETRFTDLLLPGGGALAGITKGIWAWRDFFFHERDVQQTLFQVRRRVWDPGVFYVSRSERYHELILNEHALFIMEQGALIDVERFLLNAGVIRSRVWYEDFSREILRYGWIIGPRVRETPFGPGTQVPYFYQDPLYPIDTLIKRRIIEEGIRRYYLIE